MLKNTSDFQGNVTGGYATTPSFLACLIAQFAWYVLAASIAGTLLALTAYIWPRFWITDNMSFFQLQFIGAATGGLVVSALGMLAPHRFPKFYKAGLFVQAALVVALIGLATTRIVVLTGSTAADTERAGAFRLTTINLERTYLFNDRLTHFLTEAKPDILVLEETSWDYQKQRLMNRDGITELAGHAPFPTHRFSGELGDVTVFTRFPITEQKSILVKGHEERWEHTDREILSLRIETPETPIRLFAIHPASPRNSAQWRDRDRYLERLDQLVADAQAEEPDVPIVMAGDWNLSPWSGNYARLLEKHGLQTEFPGLIPHPTRFFYDYRLRWALGATVDHIVTSKGLQVTEPEVGGDIGSDHVPLFMDIVPATANVGQ